MRPPWNVGEFYYDATVSEKIKPTHNALLVNNAQECLRMMYSGYLVFYLSSTISIPYLLLPSDIVHHPS